jgi:serpin B
MKTISIVLIFACAMICFGQKSDVTCVARGNTNFAIDIYNKIRQESGNIFFSPYSISTAFAMTYVGARCETEKQMAHTLHFPLAQGRLHPAFSELQSKLQSLQEIFEFKLNIANALWIEKSYELLSDFLDVNQKYYDANLFHLDFKEDTENSRLKINGWVEEKTEGKIRDLLAEGIITALTRLVLTNTIYFKAEWEKQFPADSTKTDDFWLTAEEKTDVQMMQQKSYFGYSENENLQVLEMRYKGRALSMFVFLPRNKDGLCEMESQLNSDKLKEWTSNLVRQEVVVFMPKFKTTKDLNLKEILISLGMTDAFSLNADFSGMEPKKELCITDAVHKAFIELDEAGTEAAAATAVVVGVKSALPGKEPPVFRADHPFMFLIRDNETQSILFMGRLTKPDS